MANVTFCQRTFSKMVFVPTNASGIELTCVDSSGNTINCNYVSVQFSPSALPVGSASLIVEPSGSISYAQNVSSMNSAGLSSTANTNNSGAGGFIIPGAFGQVSKYEYLCQGNENFNKILFRNFDMGGVAAVTYGLVIPINNIRLLDKYQYSKGS